MIRLRSVLVPLVTVEDQSISDLFSLFGLVHSFGHQFNCIVFGKDAGHNKAIEEVFDRREICPALAGQNVGNINGLITNDKFCMIRHAKLKLRTPPSYPLCYHPAYQPDRRYPSDETFHPGGNHETSMVYSPTTPTLSGWTTTLGSRVSIPPTMDPQLSVDGEHSIDDLGSTSGGES